MPEQPIKDKTAIVGIGWTPFTRDSGTSAANLAAQVSLVAIEDAGLSVRDIDGGITYFHEHQDTCAPRELADMLGMPRSNFNVFHDGGGSWSPAAVSNAAMLVFDWVGLPGTGTVYSYVIVHHSTNPAFAEDVPYTVAEILVNAKDQIRITSNIVGCPPEKVYVGMPVQVVFEDVADEITLPKFRPV